MPMNRYLLLQVYAGECCYYSIESEKTIEQIEFEFYRNVALAGELENFSFYGHRIINVPIDQFNRFEMISLEEFFSRHKPI